MKGPGDPAPRGLLLALSPVIEVGGLLLAGLVIGTVGLALSGKWCLLGVQQGWRRRRRGVQIIADG